MPLRDVLRQHLSRVLTVHPPTLIAGFPCPPECEAELRALGVLDPDPLDPRLSRLADAALTPALAAAIDAAVDSLLASRVSTHICTHCAGAGVPPGSVTETICPACRGKKLLNPPPCCAKQIPLRPFIEGPIRSRPWICLNCFTVLFDPNLATTGGMDR